MNNNSPQITNQTTIHRTLTNTTPKDDFAPSKLNFTPSLTFRKAITSCTQTTENKIIKKLFLPPRASPATH